MFLAVKVHWQRLLQSAVGIRGFSCFVHDCNQQQRQQQLMKQFEEVEDEVCYEDDYRTVMEMQCTVDKTCFLCLQGELCEVAAVERGRWEGLQIHVFWAMVDDCKGALKW